jgi:hypothetical protein
MTELDLIRLHEQSQAASRRSRYILAPRIQAPHPRDPRRVMADAVEHEAACRLREMGFQVAKQRHKAHFDILADGLRVEVKAAKWDGEKYLFNLHDNEADAIMLFCSDASCWFVAPFDIVSGRRYVKVTQQEPRNYVGRLTMFYEAWEILPDLARTVGNPYQRGLWE